jgi:L-histidine N-alpha-methyltransferase
VSIAIDIHLDADTASEMASDVRDGLSAWPKELAPKWFYDERGSQLFERITELEEYYPTRAERSILADRAADIVLAAGSPGTLIELGSGSAAKTRVLLDAMRAAGSLEVYAPVDISEEITQETAEALVEEYPGLHVHGLVCDFERHLERVPQAVPPRMIAFLGGTIGNLYPGPRRDFLERIRALLDPGDHLLLGTDLIKDRGRLELAYDDPEGVTAEFNKNVLQVLNRELDGDFDLDCFEHVARFDEREERMDIRLRSTCDQDVKLEAIDLVTHFAVGEEMRTEISTKFSRPRLEAVYADAGLELVGWFTDEAEDYALSLARPSN